MGALRIFLALSVVIGHTAPFFGLRMMGAATAVWLFFITSGFYMQLILRSKYAGALRTFYANRGLRIYPTFLVALAISLVTRGYPDTSSLSVAGKVAVAIPNFLIFGTDLFSLFHETRDGLVFALGFEAERGATVNKYMLNGPAWSLGIELTFYAVVPWLARRTSKILVAISILSLTLRLWMEWSLPWSTYFFFPANLGFFTVGMLACRFSYSRFFAVVQNVPLAVTVAAFGALALLFGREFLPGFRDYPWMQCAVLAAALPFIFHATDATTNGSRWRRWDAALGTLSYPIYILHIPLIFALKRADWYSPAAAVTLTLIIAIIVRQTIEAPVDRWRHSRLKPSAA